MSVPHTYSPEEFARLLILYNELRANYDALQMMHELQGNEMTLHREEQMQALGLPNDDHTVIADEIRRIRDEGRAHFHELTKKQQVFASEETKEAMTLPIGRSKCCNYPVRLHVGDESTNFFVCTNCNKACDA